jgi:hypothetical protein
MKEKMNERLQRILRLALFAEVKKSELKLLLCGGSAEDLPAHYEKYQDRVFYLLEQQQEVLDCIVETSQLLMEEVINK